MSVMAGSRELWADVVVTMDDVGSVYAPGRVAVRDGRIEAVGPADGAPPPSAERVGGLVMPGLVNVHCHSPMTLLRGAGEGLPLARWLGEVMWPREARMGPDDVFWGMTLAAAELLSYGVTTTCEMYLWSEDLARAASRAGLRSLVCAPVVDAPGWERFGSWREQAEAVVSLADTFAADPLIEIGIAPHSAYTVPVEGLELAARLARDHDLLLHTHVAETRDEDADIRQRHGGSVPRLLADRGILDVPRLLAAHCVWMDDDDLDLWAEHGVAVAHCPQSNAKLASGIAPVRAMRERGIVVGLGTDGPASNNNLDLWEEIRLAPMLARLADHDADALGAADALAMATRDASRALGRDDLGVLAPGRRADLIRLDLDDPAFVPTLDPTDLISHLVWSVGARAVTDVWVEGRRVVEDGRCLTVDVDEARREVTARARRLAEVAR